MLQIRLTDIEFDSAISDLLNTDVKDISVLFDDGCQVVMPIRKIIFHMIFWKVARTWGISITEKYIVDTSSINSNTISKLCTCILTDIRKRHPGNYHRVVFDFNEAMNELNNLTIDHCQEYHRSLNIVDLAMITVIPEIKQILDDKVNDPLMPMAEAEAKLKRNFILLFDQLKKPNPNNKISPFTNLRFVKPTQLAHIFYQIGFRTDIGEDIIRYPVIGNYLNGLRNCTEYALEALSAKKSAFYNKSSIPVAEYFGRRQHLLLSTIHTLYPGDCGTHVTNQMLITDKLKDVVLYKNIVDNDKLVTLDSDNISKYLGKMVEFRTPIGCRHRDGVCRVCAGELLSNITPGFHIGIFSAIQTTENITQVILSAKHLQGTTAIKYSIPDELSEFMIKKKGGIYIKSKIAEKAKNLSLMLTVSDAIHLVGLQDIDIASLKTINESSFGRVDSVVLSKGDVPITDQISLEDNGQRPMYSADLIRYIISNPNKVLIRDDLFIVDLFEYDFELPLFKITVMNDSMVKFVNNVKVLLETKISKETSANKLINEFADLVYDHVKPNLSYLEVVLKAAMISSNMDLRVPIVDNISNVMFSTNENINKMRAVGTLCAFQGLPKALVNPAFFVQPKVFSSFDYFLNLKNKATP